MKDVSERKTVLLGQRDVQAVIGSRCLQFEVEAAAEPLAQRQSPGFVYATAERSMDNQLHASGFVEESLGDDRVLSGNRAQHGTSLQDVFDHLLGSGVVEATFISYPCCRFCQPGLGKRHTHR